MTPTKLRKVRKLRGSRTMGWGQIGQHRKHGEKGGRKPGRHKHLWSYVQRYEPNYFGKKGFKTPQGIRGQSNPTTINVAELDELTIKLAHAKKLSKKQGKPFIDLTSLGYQKLLSRGTITQPITIKIDAYSQKAHEKITEAGGQILGRPQQEAEQVEAEEEPSQEKTQSKEPPKT